MVRLTYAAIEDSWAPSRSIAMMVNSTTTPPTNGRGAGVRDYIRANWGNGRANGCSPAMFHGVNSTGKHDDQDCRIVRFTMDCDWSHAGGGEIWRLGMAAITPFLITGGTSAFGVRYSDRVIVGEMNSATT